MEQKLSRRAARENAFIAAFSTSFDVGTLEEVIEFSRQDGEYPVDDFGESLLRACAAHAAEIDALIEPRLKGWTMARLPRVSLTAMRVALAEMLYGDEKKPAVAINEAVELVKRYGAESDHQFVNGLLGTVARERGLADADTEPAPC